MGITFIGDEDEDMTVDCLTIMDSDEVYWHGLSAGKYEELRVFDPNKGSHELQSWTSDQGFADQEMFVTYDREPRVKDRQIFRRRVNHCQKRGSPHPHSLSQAIQQCVGSIMLTQCVIKTHNQNHD